MSNIMTIIHPSGFRETVLVSKVDKVGIELEGNFQLIPFFKNHFTSDGSVDGFRQLSDNYCRCDYHSCNCVESDQKSGIGETVSDILEVSEIAEWIDKNHPTQTNSSCGGHVHLSVKNASDYMTLMTEKFYEWILEKIYTWGKTNEILSSSPFWDRIGQRGTQFNYHKFDPVNQRNMVRSLQRPRYSQINYCYNQHNTVEFRFPPCFKSAKIQTRLTQEIVKLVEQYLTENPTQKPLTLRMKI